jgi:hypothetical protein
LTNDTATPNLTLSISGNVLQFARLEPPYARLVGPAGSEIKKTITITREKAYPFNLVDAKAKNGKDIEVTFEEFNKGDDNGYLLTITNKKTAAGRYADTLVLTTDSNVKPHINIRVYGQIKAAAPQTDTSAKEKSAGDS